MESLAIIFSTARKNGFRGLFSMASQEGCLFQSIKHVTSGKELDLGFLKEGQFVETMDLSGPRFMLSFDDRFSYIRGTLGLQELDEVEIHVADIPGRAGIDNKFTCIVMRNQPIGDCVKLSLVPKEIYEVKRPKDKTELFVQQGVESIISQFFKGVQTTIGNFPVVEDYHYIAGERPALMLRQMAREQGAHLFYSRGEVVMKTVEEMMKGSPIEEYWYGDKSKDNQIISYSVPGFQGLLKEKLLRPAFAFGESRGLLDTLSDIAGKLMSGDVAGATGSAVGAIGGAAKELVEAPVISSLQNPTSIKNLQKAIVPAIDLTCLGNGNLQPGKVLKIKINLNEAENPMDESIPEKVLISTVAHWYSAQKYYTRIKGVVALEG